MDFTEQALGILEDQGLTPRADIVVGPAPEHVIYVPISIKRSSEGRQEPSGRRLSEARSKFEERGLIVQFIVTDESLDDIEVGLRASLINSFPDLIRNSYLSRDGDDIRVWIDRKRNFQSSEEVFLKQHLMQFSALYGIKSVEITSISDENVATRSQILEIIRLNAPIGCEELAEVLRRRGFDVPSMDWINRKFDLLRKANLIVRLGDRRYALSFQALSILGSGKTRRSPDVARILALARRQG